VDDGWKLTASDNSVTAKDALGLDPWRGGPNNSGTWIQVELPREALLAEVQFQAALPGPLPNGGGGGRGRGGAGVGPAGFAPGGPPAAPPAPREYARNYQVRVSSNGVTWTTVADVEGARASVAISFAPTRAKFARITQTGAQVDAPPLAITLLRLFEVNGPGHP
jgi:hypothetical protein